MYNIDDYRARFTIKGLTITEETSPDGMEGFRVEGQRQGKLVDKFVPFEDVEAYLAKLSRLR